MSADEVARLRFQADLFRGDSDRMLRVIGVQPGWRCLDLCCGVGGIVDVLSTAVGPTGEVVGLDFDASKLEVARAAAAAAGRDNVRFDRGDAFATGLEARSFDLVHTRFALGIVPDGRRILDEALRLVRPGGVVFLEEAEIAGYCCYPEHPAWDVALETMVEGFRQLGADLTLGRQLHAMLHARGARDIRVHPVRHALRDGQPMHYHLPLTVTAMRESVLRLGLREAGELDEVLTALSAHLARAGTTTLSFTMVQVAAIID
jgi:SAM-dependent methyltransferase